MPFQSGGGGARGYPHALQRKATKGAISKVVRETASCTRPGLALKTSTPAFTRPFWWQNYIAADVLQ